MVVYCDRKNSQTSDFCIDFDNNFSDLRREIMCFNRNIKWDGMWNITEARKRLKNNWRLVIFKPQDKIKGWGWLNKNNKEICNIYVNSKHRNQGIGTKIVNSLHRHCQDWDRWWSQIDDWNIPSQKVFSKCNYKILI